VATSSSTEERSSRPHTSGQLTHDTNATASRVYDNVGINRGFIEYEIAL
jgi:hypothetical protein